MKGATVRLRSGYRQGRFIASGDVLEAPVELSRAYDLVYKQWYGADTPGNTRWWWRLWRRVAQFFT